MKILLIALLVTISYLSVAQSPCNSSNSLSDTLDKESFNRIINNQFTNLVNGQAKAMIGSFAGLEIKDAKLNFNGSWVFDKNLNSIS